MIYLNWGVNFDLPKRSTMQNGAFLAKPYMIYLECLLLFCFSCLFFIRVACFCCCSCSFCLLSLDIIMLTQHNFVAFRD